MRDFNHAEAGDLTGANRQGCEGHVRAGVAVLLQHQRVVHFVDVVTRKDKDVFGLFRADRVDILIDRVRCAGVPVFVHALHGRQDLDKLAEFVRYHRTPALADVAVERQRLVLGQDVDMAQVGVDAVRECDVDDAVLPGKRHRGLGAISCERKKSLAGTTGKQDAQRISHRKLPQEHLSLSNAFETTGARRSDAKKLHLALQSKAGAKN